MDASKENWGFFLAWASTQGVELVTDVEMSSGEAKYSGAYIVRRMPSLYGYSYDLPEPFSMERPLSFLRMLQICQICRIRRPDFVPTEVRERYKLLCNSPGAAEMLD